MPLQADTPVYRAFAQADAAQIRLNERDFAHDDGGPGHLSCMLFATYACPYLATPTSRLSKASTIAPGAKRGARAAVMGFEDVELIIREPQRNAMVTLPDLAPKFAYLELCEDLHYREPSDLIERYSSAMARDEATCSTGTRYYWDYQANDEVHALVHQTMQRMLATGEPHRLIELLGNHAATFRLPL